MKTFVTYVVLGAALSIFGAKQSFADDENKKPDEPAQVEDETAVEEESKGEQTEAVEETKETQETRETQETEEIEAVEEEESEGDQTEPVEETQETQEAEPVEPKRPEKLPPIETLDVAALQQDILADYFRNKTMQTWGHALLGSGMGITIIGLTLVEIDSWGSIGKAGFASVGAGLGVSFVGMFLLGFSRPVHDLQPSRKFSAAPTADKHGATVSYDIYF